MVFLQSAGVRTACVRRLVPACLLAVSVSSAMAEPAAPAMAVMSTSAPFAAVAERVATEQLLAQQLAADRQFIAQSLAQQQQKLEQLMALSQADMTQPPASTPFRSMFTSRISEFAEAQSGIVTDYSELLRLRTAGVATAVVDRGAALSLLFAQTGFIFETPNVGVVVPTPLPAPTLPSPIGPFPGFSGAVGGFFAAQGQ